MIGYKFLCKGLKSEYDGSPWEIGKWRIENPPEEECIGLNCSKLIPDALRSVRGEVLAKVEYGGKVIAGVDKLTCEKMRIIKAWKWTKKESVRTAIFAARSCLDKFEKTYSDDDSPRKAIEAAEKWLADPTKKNAAAAAWSAAGAAAKSAKGVAAFAAKSAAWSAASAAWSAASVAWSAVGSAAKSEAFAAGVAAWFSAFAATKRKIHNYILASFPEMKEIMRRKAGKKKP